jgi:predicted transcriptional regulator
LIKIINGNMPKSFILVFLNNILLDFKNLYEKISEKIPDDEDKELLKELIDILEKDGNEKISENLDERLEKFTQGI